MALRKRVEAATKPSHLDRDEDPVDAVLCAYVGLFSYRRPEDVTIYGDAASGYIVTPSLPADRTAVAPPKRKKAATPPAPSAAVAEYAARRSGLVTATDHYLQLVTSLIDDARIFTGRGDYPSRAELEATILAARPGWAVEVRDDVVRAHARRPVSRSGR